jgi:hypothetical protein
VGFTGSLIVIYGVGGLVVFPAIRSFIANNAFVPFTFVFALLQQKFFSHLIFHWIWEAFTHMLKRFCTILFSGHQ